MSYAFKERIRNIDFKQQWISNDIIDVAQRLIYREIGIESNFQSALN